jgi:simple sugar transport system permease protein
VINLSLDGTILIAAMTAFALAFLTGNPWLGLTGGGLIGAFSALLVALLGLVLGRSQLAVGFILTLFWRDLAYFLGNPFARQHGPQLPVWSLPGIEELPFLGSFIGHHTPVVYLSLILTGLIWWWMYRTSAGLRLRAVGEAPRSAYGRGLNVLAVRIVYTLIGGSLTGLAGAAFSLAVKPGWGRPQGAEGSGWIALAIVIFGGWHPTRVALGAYFFATLQVLGIFLQDYLPGVPASLFQVAPFPVMILTLLLVNLGRSGWLQDVSGRHPELAKWLKRWQVQAPAALGKEFSPERE